MEDHLSEFEVQRKRYANQPSDIIDQGILLWNLFHNMILKYRSGNKDWVFYKHENLSRESDKKFGEIYNKLGLNINCREDNGSYFSQFKGENSFKKDIVNLI